MHVHFEAIVAHNTKKINDDDDAKCTLFTGLDKCVPDQQYLKVFLFFRTCCIHPQSRRLLIILMKS